MALHDDIKRIIDAQGKDVLRSMTFTNILSDISTDCNNNPAIKNIFKVMANNGYIEMLIGIEIEDHQTRLLKAQVLAKDFAAKNGFREDMVDYLTSCILYALGWTECVAKDSTKAEKELYDPKTDLEHYRYPTIDLLNQGNNDNISLKSILKSHEYSNTQMELPCAIGRTTSNDVFMFDLAEAPHLLVAGATGQGKSVCLNAIITSLLYKKHPAELKFVLVDQMNVEFGIYNQIENHFLARLEDEYGSVITNAQQLSKTLSSLNQLMDCRYELLKKANVRNIKDYNDKFRNRQLDPNAGHEYMPYIVVVVDEYADFIVKVGKEIELPICRIAQLARPVGIHMIISTQRPQANIISGAIKANFPARIALRVGSVMDSRIILDRTGAQQLMGKGDMLFLKGEKPIRVQCAFVDTIEVENICHHIAAQQAYLHPMFLPEVAKIEGDGMGNFDRSRLDPMFADIAKFVVAHDNGSTSSIQRNFSIGYNRAGQIMDQLEKMGVVGPQSGAKPREVLIKDPITLESLLGSIIDGYHRDHENNNQKQKEVQPSFSDNIQNENSNVETKPDNTKRTGNDFRTKLLKFLKWLLSIPLIILAHIINFVQEKGCVKTGCLVVVAVPIIMGTISNLLDSNNNDNNKEDKVEEVPIALVQVIDSLFEQDRNNNWENSVVAEKCSESFKERFVKVIEADTSIMSSVPLYLSEWKKLSKGQYLLHFYGGEFWSKIDWKGHDVDFHVYCVVTEDVVMTLNQRKHYIVNGKYLKQIPKIQRYKIKDKIYYQENVEISSDRYERKFKFDLHDFFVENPTIIESKED